MQFAIQAENLNKTFGKKNDKVEALKSFSLEARPGEITALIGPDGAGKTTFMRLCAFLLAPTSGELEVLGFKYGKSNYAAQNQIAYMPQKFGLYQDLSIMENLSLFADLHGVKEPERSKIFKRLLTMTGLLPFTSRLAKDLSGGMKQKLGLACSLIHAPKVLLLDEPTAGVDPLSRRELWKILNEYTASSETGILVSTGYLDEASLCDRVFMVAEGKNIGEGKPADLTEKFKNQVLFARQPDLLVRHMLDKAMATGMTLDLRPSGNGIRVLLKSPELLAPFKAKLPGFIFSETPPLLEDAYMAALKEKSGSEEKFAVFSEAEKDGVNIPAPGANTEKLGPPVIVVKDLLKKFGNFTAVNHTSFEVSRGEIFGLLGPNGAGKTTTFRMLCGLLPATSGKLEVLGVNLRTARAQARENIGYVAQFFSLYGLFTVEENLNFFGRSYGMRGKPLEERIKELCANFDLLNKLNVPSRNLNVGYQKRLSMAAALIHNPAILFLDEPTSGIDPVARRAFWAAINALADQGKTIIVTTHFMEEAEYCTRIAIQSQGNLLALGTPSEVKEKAGLPVSAEMNEAFIKIVEQSQKKGAS